MTEFNFYLVKFHITLSQTSKQNLKSPVILNVKKNIYINSHHASFHKHGFQLLLDQCFQRVALHWFNGLSYSISLSAAVALTLTKLAMPDSCIFTVLSALQFLFESCNAIINIKFYCLPIAVPQSLWFSFQAFLTVTLCWYSARYDEWLQVPFHRLHLCLLPGSFLLATFTLKWSENKKWLRVYAGIQIWSSEFWIHSRIRSLSKPSFIEARLCSDWSDVPVCCRFYRCLRVGQITHSHTANENLKSGITQDSFLPFGRLI